MAPISQIATELGSGFFSPSTFGNVSIKKNLAKWNNRIFIPSHFILFSRNQPKKRPNFFEGPKLTRGEGIHWSNEFERILRPKTLNLPKQLSARQKKNCATCRHSVQMSRFVASFLWCFKPNFRERIILNHTGDTPHALCKIPVDGRNPKQPPGMYSIHNGIKYYCNQLVQDVFHQPYVSRFLVFSFSRRPSICHHQQCSSKVKKPQNRHSTLVDRVGPCPSKYTTV